MADLNELQRRMENALKALATEFSGLRTGRASANLLETVIVDAYGSLLPLNQCGNVTVPEPRLLSVQVWDKGLVKAVEKAITNANLGLNPSADGQTVRVPVPDLTEERRKELVKVAAKYAENSRIAIRNIRRDGNDFYKKEEKDGKISKDDAAKKVDQIQKLTDDFIKKVDDSLKAKEKDILSV
jgi:ribosome recycling factor